MPFISIYAKDIQKNNNIVPKFSYKLKRIVSHDDVGVVFCLHVNVLNAFFSIEKEHLKVHLLIRNSLIVFVVNI